jgi:trans-aconitate methyltransferase
MGTMYFAAQALPQVISLIQKYYKGGSVLDYGCGTGRYTDYFDEDSYLGVDGYPQNIDFCKSNWPKRKFELADLEDWKPKKKFDYLFSSVTCEQIANLPDLRKFAKTVILVEPIGFKHDYTGRFKPSVSVGLEGAEAVLRFMVCENVDT